MSSFFSINRPAINVTIVQFIILAYRTKNVLIQAYHKVNTIYQHAVSVNISLRFVRSQFHWIRNSVIVHNEVLKLQFVLQIICNFLSIANSIILWHSHSETLDTNPPMDHRNMGNLKIHSNPSSEIYDNPGSVIRKCRWAAIYKVSAQTDCWASLGSRYEVLTKYVHY